MDLAEQKLSGLAGTWRNGFTVQPPQAWPWSGMRPTQPREEGGRYPVRANAQVNTDVGPGEVGVDLRLPCAHHLI